MTPILSVVIPTFNRPGTLLEAIESALQSAPSRDVEVIVVPNGSNHSWKQIAERFRKEARVRWAPLLAAGACAARNYGMSIANGKYIRFLDDDDTLYCEAAKQIELQELHGATVSSAPLLNVWGKNQAETITPLPASEDFVVAALHSIGSMGFNQGSSYLRSAILDCRWNENASLYDDYIWLLEIAKKREVRWLKLENPTASYVQHAGNRLSYLGRSSKHSRHVVDAICDLHRSLEDAARSSRARAQAAATALLTHAHSVFPACPILAGQAVRQAREIDSQALPNQWLFHTFPVPTSILIPAEWAMLIPRSISRLVRRASWRSRQKLRI